MKFPMQRMLAPLCLLMSGLFLVGFFSGRGYQKQKDAEAATPKAQLQVSFDGSNWAAITVPLATTQKTASWPTNLTFMSRKP